MIFHYIQNTPVERKVIYGKLRVKNYFPSSFLLSIEVLLLNDVFDSDYIKHD